MLSNNRQQYLKSLHQQIPRSKPKIKKLYGIRTTNFPNGTVNKKPNIKGFYNSCSILIDTQVVTNRYSCAVNAEVTMTILISCWLHNFIYFFLIFFIFEKWYSYFLDDLALLNRLEMESSYSAISLASLTECKANTFFFTFFNCTVLY